MITSYLQGGLGNQMFQIAAAYSLAKEYGDKVCFDFENCYTPNQGFVSNRYIKNVYKNICNQKLSNQFNFHYEKKFSYEKIQYKENLKLIGFFQTEKYFSNLRDELKNIFDFSDFISTTKRQNFTSVHVRRGDYLNNSNYHTNLDVTYYKTAMEYFDTNFLFFSDDIAWVKENFKGKNIFYSENHNELLDFSEMMSCENNIIANSSFSWWAAYMNNNPMKKIISPSRWFGPAGPQDTHDLIPENWIKI